MAIRRACAVFLLLLVVMPFTAPFQTYDAGNAIPAPNAAPTPRAIVLPPGDTASLGARVKPVRVVPFFHVAPGTGLEMRAAVRPLPTSSAGTHPLVPPVPLTLRV